VPCGLVAWYVSRTFDPVATVVLAEPAVANLDDLIVTHSLPPSTRARVRASLEPLATFPLIGSRLEGRWQGFRFILGPWPWMIMVHEYDETKDEVGVATIADSRSASAPAQYRRARSSTEKSTQPRSQARVSPQPSHASAYASSTPGTRRSKGPSVSVISVP